MTAGKAEMLVWSTASLLTAAGGEVAGLPHDQQVYLWSVAGTVVGAAVAGVQMPAGTTHAQRAMRALLSVCAGLLLAPYAIATIPQPDGLPAWWHAFAASGIAAALAYVAVAEGPAIARRWLRGQPYDESHHPARRKGDRRGERAP